MDVVRESEIFAALSPRGPSRHERSSDVRGASPGTGLAGSLPPVNPREANPIPRLPMQVASPRSLQTSTLSPKTPHSLMMSVPMTTNECSLVWKFLCDWVKTQLAMEVPASIPGFGTFYLRVQPLGIRITLFEPDKQFLSKFSVQVDSEVPDPALAATLSSTTSRSDLAVPTAGRNRAASLVRLGEVFAFSFVEMASCCGSSVDAARAQEWLAVVIHKLGTAMSQCSRVELNIGVGVIACTDRVIQRHLLPRDSRPSPRFEYEVRTGESVVKRKLRAQAALKSVPTTQAKYSFLSGSNFSPSIQLNPVLDRTKETPDFSFGPPPRPPAAAFAPIALENKASPRSTQLQKRYQRSASPLASRISKPVPPRQELSEERDVTATMQEQTDESRVPQLFDRLSRTLCVEPDQNVSCLLPSNRIGSNFTETAAFLMTEKSASQFGYTGQLTGGLVFVEKPVTKPLQTRRRKELTPDSTSEQRYFEYLADDKLIDRCYLAPLPSNLEARVVASAVKYIMGPSSDHIEEVMEAAHREFVDNYYVSAKKAILNYLLMRATSRERLGIPQGIPVHALLPSKWKWGSSDGINGCIGDLKALVLKRGRSASSGMSKRLKNTTGTQARSDGLSRSEGARGKTARRKRVHTKLMSLLVLSNPQVRALRYMWHDLHNSVSLVDLPSAQGLSDGIEPMDILEFERTQLAYSAKMKAFVMENWYTKTKMMFESAIRAETFSIHASEAAVNFRLRHLFDTVAAVMSLQIRSLIMKSIQAYVGFFELFGGMDEKETNDSSDSNQNGEQGRPTYSGLLTTLTLQDGQIQFRDPLVDIPSRLLNVLHNIPKLFYNLGRIETQFDEPLVLPNSSSPFLWNVASQEDDIVVATIRIRAIIEQNLLHLRKLQTDYDVFALTHRYVSSVDCFHLEENGELESYRAEMERVQTTAMQLAIDNRHSQHLGLFSVDCIHVNRKLHSELAHWTIRLLQAFEQRTGRMNSELRQQYKEIAARLAKKPLDLYELVDSEAFVYSLKTSKLQELQERGNAIKQRLRFLLFERESMHVGSVAIDSSLDVPTSEDNDASSSASVTGFRLSVDLLSSTAKTVKWRSHIEKLLKEAEALLVNERARIEAMFIAKRSRFQAEIDEFEGEVRGFAKKGDLRHAATYVVQLAKMKDNMYIFRQAMEAIVKEEQKLQWKPTDFGKLDDIAEEMAPYEQLWKTVREFREMNSRWLRGNIFELPGKEGLLTLQQMLSVVANVSSVLLLNSAAAAITAETVRKQMTDFRENVRLIVAIQNPAMKERHMKAVSALIGLDFIADETITLLKLLENGAFEMVNEIVDISSNATQEQQIERALNDMGAEWDATSFELAPSRHSFSSGAVLAPFVTAQDLASEAWNVILDKLCAERIVSLMDDHLLRLQTLSCMAHAGPFTEDIALWQGFVSDTGQIVEMLQLIEQLWRKLTPLFAAGIVDAESKESQFFAQAAQLYHSIHGTILNQPVCKAYFPRVTTVRDLDVTSLSPSIALISDLNRCRELLEIVKGGVRVGFETKRSSFARFYFLSDAELVTALALARVPGDATLWKALSRCFPGISGVQTNAANEITALLSAAGEPFPLGSPIVTNNIPMPVWLAKVESSMSTILHASIRAACSDLPRKEFRKWCLIWPEQSLLAAVHYVWTLESEQAYQEVNQRKAWTELTDSLYKNLDAVSREIKVAAYPHAKAALGNVILLLTQLRDVSSQVLKEVGGMWIDENGGSIREMRRQSQQIVFPRHSPSLTWISQPRFYFIDSVLSVTVLSSSYLPYGLEYLGNGSTGILVTPLTLRCYHAIAQAASTMIKGVCVEGAAGTGKSTICHQFARLCGRLYVTFQCASRKLSFDALANFIKATASSGAWLCMDNMQLLDPTTVSMVAMLCSQVMTSLAARHAQCTLAGDKVRLRRGAMFLLTLTTRSHSMAASHCVPQSKDLIPDARFFFRTIVVQSPDIEILAEFELQCARFVYAPELAKLVTVALTAYARGFELINDPTAITHEMTVLADKLVTLRQVIRVVKHATELNNLEKEHRRRTRKSILITPDDESEETPATGEVVSNDAGAEATAKRDEERMEYRNVSQAIRELLGALVPSANLHLIDAVIRDFNAQALGKDLHMNKGTMRMSRGSSMLPGSRLGTLPPKKSLEDDVESHVRTNESSWKRFGVEFGLKTVQLLQTMRTHRAVILSGDIQAGKTSLYASLSRALTQIAKRKADERSAVTRGLGFGVPDSETGFVSPVRTVVVCPRALKLGQLIDPAADHPSHSVFYKLLNEAKAFNKADKRTQTWFVFDGDLDALWSEQLLYTVEEMQDDTPGYKQGLHLSSGKLLLIPEYVRVIMETTTLTNASPSFISRVGAVHVCTDHRSRTGECWENVYGIWKTVRRPDFGGYAAAIFAALDALLAETISASLAFVSTNFQSPYSGVERVQWMLALFHSALVQSWRKFGSLTSDKQRHTAVHCQFLQALVWGVGSTTNTVERHKFHLFLYDLILHGPNSEQSTLKRLVTLFFPSGTLIGSVSNIAGTNNPTSSGGGSAIRRQTIYDYGFSVDFGSKWLPWTEYYTRWEKMLLGSASTELASFGSGLTPEYPVDPCLNRLLVPTLSTSAAICLSGQLLLANYPATLCGPRDCGKSVCGSAWIVLCTALSRAQGAVAQPPTPPSELESSDSEAQANDESTPEEPTSVEKIYAGFYTKASDVLVHFETVLQRIRVERQEGSKHEPESSHTVESNGGSDSTAGETSALSGKHALHVYIDDLHCFDASRRMDSAIELLRMLTEHHTIVDPSTNLLTPCQHFLPFVTRQVPSPRTQRSPTKTHDLERLVRRFIPVTLLPFSDTDLSSICESYPASVPAPSVQPALTPGSQALSTLTATTTAGGSSTAVKEADQLQSSIMKASLKLFRLLTSSNDFTVVQKDAAFNPIKLHYSFRVAQLFQIVKTICCVVRPTLALAEKSALARLWCHESARILGDGIMEPKEVSSFHRRTLEIALTTFGITDDAFSPARPEAGGIRTQSTQDWFANDLHYSFIGETGGTSGNGYHEVHDISKVEALVERSMMAMYRGETGKSDATGTSEALGVILCSFVVKHVLRMSRLLRMDRKAVLLLGARGRKLVTITRLACFICKKASMVYNIPEQETSERCPRKEDILHASDWIAAFRAAMLKSARSRDGSVVFIVKDTHLDPDSDPYRTLDQFLGGHSAISEVVAYEDLDDEIIATLREKADREKKSTPPSREGSHQSASTHHQAPSVLRSKRSIINYFFQHVRQHLQVVLIFSPPPSALADTSPSNFSWASILWRYPNVLKCCDINYVGAWSADALVAVAQKCLSHSSLASDKQSSAQLAEAAAQVYHTTTCFMGASSKGGSLSVSEGQQNATAASSRNLSLMQVDVSMLVDHVSLFAAHYDRLEQAVSVNLARYKTGLEFIDQTARILKAEQAQAELLLPEVKYKTEVRRRMSGSLEKDKITTEKLTRALELATTMAVSQRERLATVTNEYQDLIKESRGIFEEMKGTLQVFHEAFASEEEEDNAVDSDQGECDESKVEGQAEQTEAFGENADIADGVETEPESDAGITARRRLRRLVHKFAAMAQIPSSIYQLSECLGVILGIDPVEGRDEMDPDEIIMNYWKNVATELKKAKFWETLMTFDVTTNVSEKMVSTLLPICRSPDFDKDLFASVHEVAGVLCEWVQKCTNFARDFILAEPKHAQLLREQELLKQAEAQVVKSKTDILDQTHASRQTNEMRDVSEFERQRADEKLQDSTSLLHITNTAWKVLSFTRAKWQRLHDLYFELSKHWKGDLLLATATVAYTSVLPRALRLQLYQLWQEAISELVLPTPVRRSLHEVFSIRDVDLTKMILNGLPANDDSALENAVISLHSYRLPLLIDPYGAAADWLKKHLSSQNLSVVSANNTATDAAVWKAVETSIKHESALILTDVCKERLRSLHSFIGAKRRALFDAVNHDIGAGSHDSGVYRCWCHIPMEVASNLGSDGISSGSGRSKMNSPLVDTSLFEFGSDACRVFFIYRDTNEPPSWMSQYLNQLTVIQVEMTAPFVESQALQKLLESQGRLRELTEIRTLQQDMVVCDEQIVGLEDELLEFFSTEQADQVYADNSKALRIVANRSAVHTLDNTKAEANAKVQAHWRSLATYVAVSKRCLDAVWAWREFDVVRNGGNAEKMFTLSWIWQLLIRAGEVSSRSNNNLEVVMACFTSYLQQCIVMNLRDEDRLLFRFLLAFRIWQRRMEEANGPVQPVSGEGVSSTIELSLPSRRIADTEMLARLLALINSKMERNSYDACRPSLKSLLSLRPAGIKATAWSAVCYLAEASGDLRQFISRMESMEDGQIAWKALLELGTGSSCDWQVPVPVDDFTRLCLVTAVYPHRFMCEIEDFAGRELQRMHTTPVSVSHSISLIPETNTPSLPTVVAAAAHTAMAQAPDRHRDLFFMWQSFSSSKVPLVVFCPPSIDFVDAVADVARRAGATMDTTDSIQLLLADQEAFRAVLLQAMEKGQWVVLPNFEICHDRFAQLSSIYDSLEDGRAHSDFRLWISITSQNINAHAMRYASFDSMRMTRAASKREWGTGALSLKRCLHHTFAILKRELETFEFASSYAANPTATPTGLSLISEYEEQCMKQLGVFHALVSCRDHFPFVQWKSKGEFGDPELFGAIRSLVVLRNEERTLIKELPSPLSKPDTGIWTSITLRGVISSVYISGVKSPQDQLLIQSCIDLVLNAWPAAQDEGHLHPTAIVAQLSIPEAVYAIEKLAVIPWAAIVSSIPHFWISESCGPSLSKDLLTAAVPHSDGVSLWDPHHLRRDRQRQIVTQLAVMVANRGCQVPTRLMTPRSLPNMEVMQSLEFLAAFRKNLEGVVMLLRGGEFEYRKPIAALIYHERQILEQIRTMVLRDIGRLELVAYRGGSLDSATWQLANELRGGRTPACWLALLRLPGAGGVQRLSLEKFQQILLDRLNAFASWREPSGDSYKLPLSQFMDVECVFEAVHQHFIRNHVGSALCSADCLKVVSMFEDSPRLTLPTKEDIIYFTGVRAMGHLQLQILDSKGRVRRTPISPEGVSVVLKVTSSCLAEVLGASSHPSESHVESDTSKTEDPGNSSTPIEYPCPLVHTLDGSESYKGGKSIRVTSSLPLEQLVFSGASLRIQSVETNEK